jgi:heme exporter protein D
MNWAKFFSMGGYAFFVWGSYLTAFVAIGGEIFFLWRRKQSLEHTRQMLGENNRNEKTS